MGRMIRLGEWISFRKGDQWNHAFVIDRVENGVAYVLQATLKGVTNTATLDEVAPGGKYITFAPPEIVMSKELPIEAVRLAVQAACDTHIYAVAPVVAKEIT